MKILHGTWIPDAHSDFVQAGAFYLWVETALPEHAASADHSQHLGPQHSGPQHSGPQHFGIQHLESAELAEFLSQELGFAAANTKAIAKDISPKFFYLPTAAEWPLPSPELARYLELETSADFDWQIWEIDCCRLTRFWGNKPANTQSA